MLTVKILYSIMRQISVMKKPKNPDITILENIFQTKNMRVYFLNKIK